MERLASACELLQSNGVDRSQLENLELGVDPELVLSACMALSDGRSSPSLRDSGRSYESAPPPPGRFHRRSMKIQSPLVATNSRLVTQGRAYDASCPAGTEPLNGLFCASQCPPNTVRRGPMCMGRCDLLGHRSGTNATAANWHALLFFCARTLRARSAEHSDCPWYDPCGINVARGCARCRDEDKAAGFVHQTGCVCVRRPALAWRAGTHARTLHRYTCPRSPADVLLEFEPLFSRRPVCYDCQRDPGNWRCGRGAARSN